MSHPTIVGRELAESWSRTGLRACISLWATLLWLEIKKCSMLWGENKGGWKGLEAAAAGNRTPGAWAEERTTQATIYVFQKLLLKKVVTMYVTVITTNFPTHLTSQSSSFSISFIGTLTTTTSIWCLFQLSGDTGMSLRSWYRSYGDVTKELFVHRGASRTQTICIFGA